MSGGAEAGRAARGHSGKATAAATNGSPHVRQQQGDSHATGVGTRNALEPGVVSPRGAGVSEGPRIDAKERSRGIPVAGAGAAGVAADTAVAADAARSPVANAVGVREEGVLRPSIVLAKNPNREGHLWPARLCDRDEVQESYAHSDLDAQAQVTFGGVLKVLLRTFISLLLVGHVLQTVYYMCCAVLLLYAL